MILRSEELARRLHPETEELKSDPFILTPRPDIAHLKEAGAASVDLRLGTWFAELKKTRTEVLDVFDKTDGKEDIHLIKKHYVPFGDKFILHPKAFILGVTLEWIRMPRDLAGYVTSRSSWGRRGLIIATATGVHPGFSGCLTLELSNVGEVPIALYPGADICQFFLHTAEKKSDHIDRSRLIGKRQPSLGRVALDQFATALATYGSGAHTC